jgi:hypothetical protein
MPRRQLTSTQLAGIEKFEIRRSISFDDLCTIESNAVQFRAAFLLETV